MLPPRPISRSDSRASVIVLLADGARPDALARAMDDGELPALARLRDEGGAHTISTVFPSVTGPAYVPFLMGRFPGAVGLPGLRWYDRARLRASAPDYCRSYVGPDMRHVDADIDAGAPTVFELAPSALGAMSMIRRGLPGRSRIGRGALFAIRAAAIHFRGDVRGWLGIDRDIAGSVARHIRTERPAFTFAAFTGIDKTSHAEGHESPATLDAMRIVDDLAAELRHDAERDGVWDDTHLWIASDHGHSRVLHHDDLASVIRSAGHGVIAHPWVHGHRRDVAVMVSGNAMAQLYVELARRERPWWGALADRWESLAEQLLARPSIDLMLLPHSPNCCEVRSAARGNALVELLDGSYCYRPLTGDPLGLGDPPPLSADDSHALTMESDYPDALVQIIALAGSSRAGDVMLSAARDWDFRAKWEPIPHVSSHGALHREHMLVPLLVNQPVIEPPRRTTDVFASAMQLIGVPEPRTIDGRSYAGVGVPAM